ncbi:erythrocyte band 7 integral membrane protein-like [Folsomia candida]|nr:erythrocyte band 7 integral membrane protein-like [Folsomia candida]
MPSSHSNHSHPSRHSHFPQPPPPTLPEMQMQVPMNPAPYNPAPYNPPSQNEITIAPETEQSSGSAMIECLATLGSMFLFFISFPVAIFFCFKSVQEYQRAVIFRLGRIRPGGARGPGIFFVLPCIDDYRCIDLRTVTYDVPPQEILTKDSVTAAVDAIVFFKVWKPVLAITNVENYRQATQLLSSTTLRNILGTLTLSQILSDREHISQTMQRLMDEATDPWGIKVERVELKDVRLPIQLQRAMASEAEATRDARAKVLAAEGEMEASKALKQASDVMMSSPAALQLRYLQTLTTIAAEKNSTVIFPLPIEFLKSFGK